MSHFLHISPFTLHSLCIYIYIARAEYFLIPDDAVDRRKLGFQFLVFKQQCKASIEQFLYTVFTINKKAITYISWYIMDFIL